MPELPEIEHLAASLRSTIVGRSIVDSRCKQPKMLNLAPEEFARQARGQVVAVTRRAKSCVLRLEKGSIWLHLGLGGEVKLAHRPEGEPQLALLLDDDRQLILDKTFMGHAHFFSEADLPQRWQDFGPEPLGDEFTVETLRSLLAGRAKQAVKAVLMDQSRLAGIGNVYSDEILHAARLHPARPAGSLDAEETQRLYDAIRGVLRESIAAGGVEEYADVHGQRGHYELRIHGTQFCHTCGGPASKVASGGRTAYYCPACQSQG